MKTTRALALLATTLLTTGLASATGPLGTAATASPTTALALGTSLRLTVAHGETPSAGTPRTVTLECPPAGGTANTHPDPYTACRLVDSVSGDLNRLDVDPGVCTDQFDPYTVTASGTYRSRPLSFRHTYGNHCVLLRTTGAVFDF
ncbi:SSI family serine proteinase inhibitor [Kitasatospora purpeofusca]|uniref:SSI family serine proteinase inhibitor n=1 Tax=Kitasatospora purpeofusca TaxID=67352 RepID=UPI002A5AFFDC|nr:SSI family serine proteinase inhibitor [Kitasatospora purpeofusca]MDY0816624.1 SSI family serine proteinase inhibitor [Kitasatospora purpeofusca]